MTSQLLAVASSLLSVGFARLSTHDRPLAATFAQKVFAVVWPGIPKMELSSPMAAPQSKQKERQLFGPAPGHWSGGLSTKPPSLSPCLSTSKTSRVHFFPYATPAWRSPSRATTSAWLRGFPGGSPKSFLCSGCPPGNKFGQLGTRWWLPII